MFLLFICLACMALTGWTFAYDEDENKFDSSYVLDDLKSSTGENQRFDMENYPVNLDAKGPSVINFVEYCYSYRANQFNNYGLYIYLYNPTQLNIEDNLANRVQIATKYDSDGSVLEYKKFYLKLCNYSVDSGMRYLFYKFRVSDPSGIIFDRVKNTQSKRVYDVSGFEVKIADDNLTTEYNVGGSYSFSGYSKGYGEDTEVNTLTSEQKELETIELDVEQTHYRTYKGEKGFITQENQISSVYFGVPERIYEEYGKLQQIKCEWYEYRTQPILVTNDKSVYDSVYDVRRRPATKNDEIYLFNGYSQIQTGGTFDKNISHGSKWVYNADCFRNIPNFVGNFFNFENEVDFIPWVYYSDFETGSSAFDSLHKTVKKIVRVEEGRDEQVSTTQIQDYMYDYYDDIGSGFYDVAGRDISKALFLDNAGVSSNGQARTMGYNEPLIDLGDNFSILENSGWHHSWDKFWKFGMSSNEGGTFDVEPIVEVGNILNSSKSDISRDYLVNYNDTEDFTEYYSDASSSDERMVMLRFANTIYESFFVGSGENSYIAQENVFLNFDILWLTFSKEGVYHVIPTVSSPIDVVGGLSFPIGGESPNNWWEIVIAVVMLVLFVLLLSKFLPYIIKGIIWLVKLPFVAIKKISKSVKANKGSSSSSVTYVVSDKEYNKNSKFEEDKNMIIRRKNK